MSVYLVVNKVSTSTPATVTNLESGEVTEHKSMYSAIRSIRVNVPRSSFTKTYVLNRQPYNNYLVEFVNDRDHITTKLRMLKDKAKSNANKRKQ